MKLLCQGGGCAVGCGTVCFGLYAGVFIQRTLQAGVHCLTTEVYLTQGSGGYCCDWLALSVDVTQLFNAEVG